MCLEGLGAVLSQSQDDGHLHTIAYASREHSPSEKSYGITELETLAVVWVLSHFHFYLYNQSVTLYTDHAAFLRICSFQENTLDGGKRSTAME